MTEKLLTFPSPTSPDPGDGVNRSKFKFFSRTAPIQTNKDICTETTCADPGNFLSGVGGMGSRLLNLFYSLQRGPVALLHIFQRGVHMPISIETHITITCDFPGGWGSGPPIPLLDPHVDNVTVWHE